MRLDDKNRNLEERIKYHLTEIPKILDYYQNSPILFHINANQSVDDVFKNIQQILEDPKYLENYEQHMKENISRNDNIEVFSRLFFLRLFLLFWNSFIHLFDCSLKQNLFSLEWQYSDDNIREIATHETPINEAIVR
jgi:hypothetical protein